ncbi:hypothetical protein [Undibacterium fentianense]|uniref:Outer membrane protein n=1 Tax=Undibacterium fentianense TaxID=2828728 RepID=A0A941ICK6_9BURK|nr:hypothetical protein [Undibacterium fentianense]MBR7798978.1 hypothetical protein [Undibacterium fentianense]
MMKRIVYQAPACCLLIIAGHVHAQNWAPDTLNASRTYVRSPALLTAFSTNQNIELASPYNVTLSTNERDKRGLLLNQWSSTKFHYSKNQELDFGLDLNVSRLLDPFENAGRDVPSKLISSVSTSAFLNYRLNPNYSLNGEFRFGTGFEKGSKLTLAAKANKIFSKRHQLTAVFSVNWHHNATVPQSNFGALDWRGLQGATALANNKFNRTELQLGGSWNWTLDTNWSISTGISARHTLNSSTRNPFMTQRSPVTIFSVATYRF